MRVLEVHNAWTIYALDEHGKRTDRPFAQHSRPQDWGDPRWTYRRYRFEHELDGTRYINNAHCWTDWKAPQEADYTEFFASLIVLALMPGTPKEICGREYLNDDDFWQSTWGKQPPYYEGDEDSWATIEQNETDMARQAADPYPPDDIPIAEIPEAPGMPPQFIERFIAMTKDRELITLQTSKTDAWAVVTMLQLAHRHPEVPEWLKDGVKRFGRTLADRIAPRPDPMGDFLEMGWHEQYDQPKR